MERSNYWAPHNIAYVIVNRMQEESAVDESDDTVHLSGGDAARLKDHLARSWEIANSELLVERDGLQKRIEQLEQELQVYQQDLQTYQQSFEASCEYAALDLLYKAMELVKPEIRRSKNDQGRNDYADCENKRIEQLEAKRASLEKQLLDLRDAIAPESHSVQHSIEQVRALRRDRDNLRQEIAGFPNLAAMRQCMVDAADENKSLRLQVSQLEVYQHFYNEIWSANKETDLNLFWGVVQKALENTQRKVERFEL